MSSWHDPERWHALCAGTACPICQRGEPLHIVAGLDASWLTMPDNGPMPGYACLVSRIHAVELYDLPDEAAAAFMHDMRRAARAVAEATGAVKLNYEVHGNVLPHLHLHIFPRHRGDRFEGQPIDPRPLDHSSYAPGEFAVVRDAIVAALARSAASSPIRPQETIMSLRINDLTPNFTAATTHGTIDFHQWIGDSWAVLFSHPKDFTPVCTTELGYMARIEGEFTKRNTKLIALSVDTVESHNGWLPDIEETQNAKVNYPIIADTDLGIAKAYNMLPADLEAASSDGRTASDNLTVRSVFVIGPDKRVKMMLTYPMTTGRNFDEILRVIDSLQLTAKFKVATPANWKNGDDVIIAGSVSDDDAKGIYPNGWKAPRPYLRIVPQPK